MGCGVLRSVLQIIAGCSLVLRREVPLKQKTVSRGCTVFVVCETILHSFDETVLIRGH